MIAKQDKSLKLLKKNQIETILAHFKGELERVNQADDFTDDMKLKFPSVASVRANRLSEINAAIAVCEHALACIELLPWGIIEPR